MKVRDLRARKRWTQAKLAAVAEVGLRTIVQVEQGRGISLLSQQRIADALGVERLDLFPEPETQEATA